VGRIQGLLTPTGWGEPDHAARRVLVRGQDNLLASDWCGLPGSGLSAAPFPLGERCPRLGSHAPRAASECGTQRHPPPGWQSLGRMAWTSTWRPRTRRSPDRRDITDHADRGPLQAYRPTACPRATACCSPYTTENRGVPGSSPGLVISAKRQLAARYGSSPRSTSGGRSATSVGISEVGVEQIGRARLYHSMPHCG
jgi:hypothetical protein